MSVVGVSLLFFVARGLAQTPEASADATQSIPAASLSEIECSGFIAGSAAPAESYVFDGADNDFRQYFRQFTEGDFVYLQSGGSAAVGTEYRLVRPATGSAVGGEQLPIFGRATWYPGQNRYISSLGHAYEDVGRVKVVAVTSQGSVAQVTFSCAPAAPNDLAIPFRAREIPGYNPSLTVDRFAAVGEGKRHGSIVASSANEGALRNGSIAYVDLGEPDGAKAGQRYRIFHSDREVLSGAFRFYKTPPIETVGELVILFTEERSSVGVVISTFRDVSLGDGIAPE
jgi:hypothetical protein